MVNNSCHKIKDIQLKDLLQCPSEQAGQCCQQGMTTLNVMNVRVKPEKMLTQTKQITCKAIIIVFIIVPVITVVLICPLAFDPCRADRLPPT